MRPVRAHPYIAALMTALRPTEFAHRHLLDIEDLSSRDITTLLDLSEQYVDLNRSFEKKLARLHGRTQINLFFETSTRTRTSFELAGKRLGADVINMSVEGSSIKKGETLIDTAMTLNAMQPDVMVVRHHESGAVDLLAQKVDPRRKKSRAVSSGIAPVQPQIHSFVHKNSHDLRRGYL